LLIGDLSKGKSDQPLRTRRYTKEGRRQNAKKSEVRIQKAEVKSYDADSTSAFELLTSAFEILDSALSHAFAFAAD
jgi:hypothetical protein